MSLVVNTERRTHMYGKAVRENWHVEHDDGLSIEVRVYPPEGSRRLFTLDDIPFDDVPEDVLGEIGEELDSASDAVL